MKGQKEMRVWITGCSSSHIPVVVFVSDVTVLVLPSVYGRTKQTVTSHNKEVMGKETNI